MKFELDLSRVKRHRKPAQPVEGTPCVTLHEDEGVLADEMISMTVSTAVLGLGLSFLVGMTFGYSAGFRVGKTVGQAMGITMGYSSLARMAIRL